MFDISFSLTEWTFFGGKITATMRRWVNAAAVAADRSCYAAVGWVCCMITWLVDGWHKCVGEQLIALKVSNLAAV